MVQAQKNAIYRKSYTKENTDSSASVAVGFQIISNRARFSGFASLLQTNVLCEFRIAHNPESCVHRGLWVFVTTGKLNAKLFLGISATYVKIYLVRICSREVSLSKLGLGAR